MDWFRDTEFQYLASYGLGCQVGAVNWFAFDSLVCLLLGFVWSRMSGGFRGVSVVIGWCDLVCVYKHFDLYGHQVLPLYWLGFHVLVVRCLTHLLGSCGHSMSTLVSQDVPCTGHQWSSW